MSSHTNKKIFSSKQENLVASTLGWSVVPGSGARSLHPGDIQSDEWIGECKTHETPGHRIVFNYTVWKKISDEAASRFKFPALFVDDGSQLFSYTWCMFKHRPGVPNNLVSYADRTGKSFSFSHSDLYEYRLSFDTWTPLMFQVKWNKETVYVSTLSDFMKMFA